MLDKFYICIYITNDDNISPNNIYIHIYIYIIYYWVIHYRRTALHIPPTHTWILVLLLASMEYAIRKSWDHTVMLHRCANALGNNQGHVMRLRESNARIYILLAFSHCGTSLSRYQFQDILILIFAYRASITYIISITN